MIRMRPVILGWDEMGELMRKRKIRNEPHHEVQLTLALAKEFGHHLVGGLERCLFFQILGIIIPTDFHIFQGGGSTTNQPFNIRFDTMGVSSDGWFPPGSVPTTIYTIYIHGCSMDAQHPKLRPPPPITVLAGARR